MKSQRVDNVDIKKSVSRTGEMVDEVGADLRVVRLLPAVGQLVPQTVLK